MTTEEVLIRTRLADDINRWLDSHQIAGALVMSRKEYLDWATAYDPPSSYPYFIETGENTSITIEYDPPKLFPDDDLMLVVQGTSAEDAFIDNECINLYNADPPPGPHESMEPLSAMEEDLIYTFERILEKHAYGHEWVWLGALRLFAYTECPF